MPIAFKPLLLKNTRIFGVKITGTMGRGDRQHLQKLHRKCLENDKTDLVLDFTELVTLGGGGASILADFQRQLVAHGGEAVFAGTSDIVRYFLDQKFDELPLRFYVSVDDAVQNFHSADYTAPATTGSRDPASTGGSTAAAAVDAGAKSVVTPVDTIEAAAGADELTGNDEVGAVCLAADEETDSCLDLILEAFTAASDSPAADEAVAESNAERVETPPAEAVTEQDHEPASEATAGQENELAAGTPDGQTGDANSGTPAVGAAPGESSDEESVATSPPAAQRGSPHRYCSLEEAVSSLAESPAVADLESILCNLLHSHDLADDVRVFERRVDSFVTDDAAVRFADDGPLATLLRESGRPLTLLDIHEQDLDDHETNLLADCRPDLILPLTRAGDLYAAAFLRHREAGHEYGISENFALELLTRTLDPRSDEPAPRSDVSNPAVAAATAAGDLDLTLVTDLATAENDEHFWKMFVARLEGVYPVRSLLFFHPENETQRVIGQGAQKKKLRQIDWRHEKATAFFRTLERPVAADCLPATFKQQREALIELGIHWLAPLRAETECLGVVLLGFDADAAAELDIESLARITDICSQSLGRMRKQNREADLALGLISTLIAQDELRRCGSNEYTQLLVDQVRCLAREIGFPRDQERDLVYGVLLRDIGLLAEDHAAAEATAKNTAPKSRKNCRQWLRTHPQRGIRLLETLPVPAMIREVILHHHELFDGNGYPEGLRGRDIPLAARIVAVVEYYATQITGTEDGPAVSIEQAAQTMRENAERRFDPEIVDVFLRAVEKTEVPA